MYSELSVSPYYLSFSFPGSQAVFWTISVSVSVFFLFPGSQSVPWTISVSVLSFFFSFPGSQSVFWTISVSVLSVFFSFLGSESVFWFFSVSALSVFYLSWLIVWHLTCQYLRTTVSVFFFSRLTVCPLNYKCLRTIFLFFFSWLTVCLLNYQCLRIICLLFLFLADSLSSELSVSPYFLFFSVSWLTVCLLKLSVSCSNCLFCSLFSKICFYYLSSKWARLSVLLLVLLYIGYLQYEYTSLAYFMSAICELSFIWIWL